MKAIRASYPLITHIDDNHLACTLAIDGLVFYELLVSHMEQQLSKTTVVHDDIIANSLHSLASAGRAFVQTTALRDLMMLENQIPFQVFKLIVAAELFSVKEETFAVDDNYWSYVVQNFPINLTIPIEV